ncbi:ABC transporter permease, partial [Vibrio parahaemolyticus]|nr:ABC transporter permease [Vibrio parahaemolyticus]
MVDNFIHIVGSLGRRTLSSCRAFGRATFMLIGALFSKPQPIKSIPL